MAEAALSGTERSAILLMSLGEQEAAQVLQHMDVREVQKLGSAMAALNNISPQLVGEVLHEFVQALEGQTSMGVGNHDYLRNVLVQSLGEPRAQHLLDQIVQGRECRGLDALRWMDPTAVAEVIKQEHPQVIALVLVHLESEQAARVLALLPAAVRGDVVVRVARLEGVPQAAIAELDEIVERQATDSTGIKTSAIAGIQVAADMINLLEGPQEDEIMALIQEVDDELGQQIQERMFVFDNLMSVDDRGIQALVREVSTENLALALKGADPAMREKIFRNMSKRASELLRDDMEARGPVRLSDVEAAQKEVLSVAQRLAEEGSIVIGGGEQYI